MAQPGQAGTQGKCPLCGAKFTVPGLFGQAPAGAATPQQKTAPGGGTPGKAWESQSARELWLGLALGLGAAMLFLLLLVPFHGAYFADLFLARGWVPFALVTFMGWAGGILFLKWLRLRVERIALMVDVLPLEIGEVITPENVDAFIAHGATLPKKLAGSYMLKRVRRGLDHFKARESNPEVASMMSMQSDIDSAAIGGSYAIVRVFVWAIPILGFIGTVLGISQAIAGFSADTTGAEDMGRLMESINAVTGGLGVAFDTTLVALVMSIILSFPASAMQKAEEDLLGAVDAYCLENLLKRLSDAGGVTKVAENTRALVNALAPALAREQQNLLLELRAIQQAMAEGQARQVELVERTTSAIETQKEVITARMKGLTENLETEAANTLQQTAARVSHSFQVLSDGMKELNKVLRELDGKQVKIEKKRRWFR